MSAVVTGPFNFTSPPAGGGPAINLSLPQQSPQQAVVITNTSPYPCIVTVAGQQYWLAAFMENVYALPNNRSDVQVSPQSNPSALSAGGQLLATWYAPGDSVPGGVWPMSLTAQALAFGLAAAGLAGNTTGVQTVVISVVSGADGHFVMPFPLFSLWSWGWSNFGTMPTTGTSELSLGPLTGPTDLAQDSLTVQEAASNRLAGLKADYVAGTSPVVHNGFDHDVNFYLVVSPAA